MTNLDVIEKVKKLLVRTKENGCTEGEVNAAVATARTLLAKHGLSMDDINSEEFNEVIEDEMNMETKSISLAQNRIASVLKSHFGVDVLIVKRVSESFLVIGEKDKVAVFKETLRYTYNAFKTLWNSYKNSLMCSTHEKYLARNTYLIGFCKGLDDALCESEKSTALVVIKSDAVDKFLEENHPHVKVTKTSASYSPDMSHFSKGLEDGLECQAMKHSAIA